MKYIPVMGLEIHAELLCKSKVFCTCANRFGGEENSRICPICSGAPGTLPVLNKNAVTLAVKAGLALNCKINNYSAFDRKNYFYPDLPKAYQITQFEYPICSDGFLEINGKKIGINRIHIEEDAGKLIHSQKTSSADFNRCGVPLIEIVTEPDFRCAEDVQKFIEVVAMKLKYAGVCDAKLEKGSLRVDVNISIMPENAEKFGVRAEIKNLNSIKSVVKAIEYETARQSELLESGNTIKPQTRRFDSSDNKTYLMREKEKSDDYRYFPEPDIAPINICESEIEDIKKSMGEMPEERFLRYTENYKLSEEEARLLIGDKAFSDFYDKACEFYDDRKGMANMMLGELNRNLNESGKDFSEILFSEADLAELVRMSSEGVVSKNAAKDIFKIMFCSEKAPRSIAEDEGYLENIAEERLGDEIEKAIAQNPKAVTEYKGGNKKVFGFLMGIIMRSLGKNANPVAVKELLEKKLK